MNSIKAWWDSLAQREQRIVMIASVVSLIAIIYWGIWAPLSDAVESERFGLQKQQELLSWMKENGGKIAAAGASSAASAGENQSLTQVINATAQSQKIKLTRVQPEEDAIQIWIDEVEFAVLVKWLDLLHSRYGVSVTNTELVRGEKEGFVSVKRLQLAR